MNKGKDPICPKCGYEFKQLESLQPSPLPDTQIIDELGKFLDEQPNQTAESLAKRFG